MACRKKYRRNTDAEMHAYSIKHSCLHYFFSSLYSISLHLYVYYTAMVIILWNVHVPCEQLTIWTIQKLKHKHVVRSINMVSYILVLFSIHSYTKWLESWTNIFPSLVLVSSVWVFGFMLDAKVGWSMRDKWFDYSAFLPHRTDRFWMNTCSRRSTPCKFS